MGTWPGTGDAVEVAAGVGRVSGVCESPGGVADGTSPAPSVDGGAENTVGRAGDAVSRPSCSPGASGGDAGDVDDVGIGRTGGVDVGGGEVAAGGVIDGGADDRSGRGADGRADGAQVVDGADPVVGGVVEGVGTGVVGGVVVSGAWDRAGEGDVVGGVVGGGAVAAADGGFTLGVAGEPPGATWTLTGRSRRTGTSTSTVGGVVVVLVRTGSSGRSS